MGHENPTIGENIMKRTQLALAFCALFGAGSAMAGTCPDQASLPWSDVREDQPGMLEINTPGLAGTSCAMEVTNGPARADRARVQDTTPNCEPRYRARLYIDTSDFSQMGTDNRAKVWNIQCNANDNSAGCGAFGGVAGIMQFRFQGLNGSNGLFGFTLNNLTREQFALPISNGEHWIEVDWIQASGPGANDGETRVWVDAADPDNTTPDFEITNLDNDQYCIDQTNVGIIAPTNAYIANQTGNVIRLDEFESRRQTQIGQ